MFFTFRVKGAIILIALLIPALLSAASAEAEELVISGNGSGADSEISVSTTTTTQVTQTNNQEVNNNVGVDLNTGENSASDNSGADTSISTGDITSETTIENNLNSATTSLDCCPNDPQSSIEISNNGSDSNNVVNLDQNQTTQINITQQAQVISYVAGAANTGGNEANDNTGGDVAIETGDINVDIKLENSQINQVSVNAGGGGGSVDVKITGNGADSNNTVNLNLNSLQNIIVDNKANIYNFLKFDLNTGDNQANGNSGGDVSIRSGNIVFNASIVNGPINSSIVDVRCCDSSDPADPSDPGDPNDPSGPGDPGQGGPDSSIPTNGGSSSGSNGNSSSSGSGGGSSSGGGVLGAATGTGQILPATGTQWMIILTLIAALLFMIGLYLRLHPGRDPSKRVVYA